MATCERCKMSDGECHSLQVELAGHNVLLAQFTLCQECYQYGERIEPIARVAAFLDPSHMIITDNENAPTWYYIMDCRTFEYLRGSDGRVWHDIDMADAQDRLVEVMA